MKFRPKRALAGVGALTLAGGLILATGGVALAAAPFDPDTNAIGSVTFLDANGVPITTGSINTPMAAYIAGSATTNASYTYGDLYFAQPTSGENSGLWNTDLAGVDTTYNPAPVAWPTAVKSLVTAGKPVINETPSDEKLSTFIAGFPNTPTSGPNTTVPAWQNLYQIRLTEGGNTANYESATVMVSGTTWTLVPNPDQTVSTTTTISANPASGTSALDPLPVTLTTTVTPSGSVASGYIGGIGTVVVKDGAAVIDTEIIAPGSSAPFTVSTGPINETNPSSHSFTATFTPFNGTALLGSASTALTYNVSVAHPDTVTSLASADLASVVGGGTVHFTGNVKTGTPPVAVTDGLGTVNLYNNTSTLLNPTPIPVDTSGNFSYAYVVPDPGGPYSVTATFTDPGHFNNSTSAPPLTANIPPNPNGSCATTPVTGAPTGLPTDKCSDQQYIQGTVAPGTLTVSTPYDSNHPFIVGTLALDPASGTFLTVSKVFGDGNVTGSTSDIVVTDTRAGDLDWTLQAQSSELDGTATPIDSQNVGLTALGDNPVPGFNTAGLHLSPGHPAAPGVPFGTAGHLGLGGGTNHGLAQATAGIGTVGIYGLLTLNAPTSTLAGTYTGTITFTVVGSITGDLTT